MGAYYDMIISPCRNHSDMLNLIGDFLPTRGLRMNAARALESEVINGHNAILFSPPANGWMQFVTGQDVCTDAMWYVSNPLASFLSARLQNCIHVWSLNSGHVVGYAVYANGENLECENIFSKYTKDTSQLMDGVETPPNRPGHLLNALSGLKEDFSRFMTRHEDNLECGMGNLVARFGFEVHLLDYFDATDDNSGVVIRDDVYESVQLNGWTAILFDCNSKGCNR